MKLLKMRTVILLMAIGAILGVYLSIDGFYKREEMAKKELVDRAVVWDYMLEYIRSVVGRQYAGETVAVEGLGGLAYEPTLDKFGFCAEAGFLSDTKYGEVTSRTSGKATCIKRITAKGEVFEYWVIRLFGSLTGWNKPKTSFVIAKTSELAGAREIVFMSDRYLDKYEAAEGIFIKFPDDPKVALELAPWVYQDAYKGSWLEGAKVTVKDGGYKVVGAGPDRGDR